MPIERVLRSAKSFFAGTALSRISGLLRDMAMAATFGSSPEIAAFMVSYRLANLFRRLLGEGNLSAGFIPQFIDQKERGGEFYRDTMASMVLILVFAIAGLELGFWGLRYFVPAAWVQIIDLSMLMIPGLFFISLFGLNTAFLQCQKKYFLSAAAPIVFNFIWIGAVFVCPDVHSLALAITFAFAAQWILTAWQGFAVLGVREWVRPTLFSPSFQSLLRSMVLGIIGIGAVQLNSALDAIFARLAGPEGPAFLWYAIRIQQLPLALFGMALSGALLPPLAKTENLLERKALLRKAIQYSAVLMVVCTCGIFALGKVGVNLLYGHGDFTAADVRETLHCLYGYALGLVPSVFVLLLANRFYAEKNYRIPALASLISVGVNICLNALFVFVFQWGAISIAIATSFSAFVNMAFLSRGAFDELYPFFFRLSVICALPTLLTLGVEAAWLSPFPRSLVEQLVQFGSLSGVYLGGVGLLAWRFRLGALLRNFISAGPRDAVAEAQGTQGEKEL